MWLGVDGGGTKTEGVVISDRKVVGFARGGPSNHQAVGLEDALREMTKVIQSALNDAKIERHGLQGAVLGLAGADFPEDVTRLREGLASFFEGVPFEIVNDAEIALYAGSEHGYGIAAIAGTGGNVFGVSPTGDRRQVGGLGYEWGDFGSGIDMAREVLHYAFRSAEFRGEKTVLEDMVLAMLGMPDYSQLSRALYFHEIPLNNLFVLAPICFQAASLGDSVAKRILQLTGDAVAQSVMGCAHLLGMDKMTFEVGMAGSLWLGQAPDMREAFWRGIRENLPGATAKMTERRPVAGAALMAVQPAKTELLEWREVLRLSGRLAGVE